MDPPVLFSSSCSPSLSVIHEIDRRKEEEKRANDDFMVFDPSHWKGGVGIY